ncbi:unnamed protein product, partial [Closterium sp. NIES-65]
DVSGNSLYGRINRNFKSMVADGEALINLAHNFFFGDAVLLAAGCQVCPAEITQPNNLVLSDLSSGRGAGKCVDGISGTRDYSVAGEGKAARVSVAGNCLALSPDAECAANATQRSTAACQAFLQHHGQRPVLLTVTLALTSSALSFPLVAQPPLGSVLALHGRHGGHCCGLLCWLRSAGCCALMPAVAPWTKEVGGLDVCEQYTLQQMVKATDNWAKGNVLGKGAFGIVYKGCSPQGQTWAIKRSTVMTNDFEMEVRAMASLHHVNLVRLLGFCQDLNVETGNQEQILVYEFVANGDLQHHIYRSENPLSLGDRLRIAQGAAEGLAYLHGFATPIIHRDIKPANILVTADMQAKVADFGLLKRITHGEDNQTRVAGTPGYVDPEYNRTRGGYHQERCLQAVLLLELTHNYSLACSFGIVLLALVTGRPPRATKMVEDYQVIGMKDSKLDATEEAVLAIVDLALDCIKSPGARRPDMKDIAYRLTALIDKYCSDKQSEVEEVTGKAVDEIPSDSSAGTGTISQTSTMSLGSFMNGMGSWLEKGPS